ncbi:hypothetical protein IKE67_10035 [bacterium]|nr:hypothetical protein [bacterium]
MSVFKRYISIFVLVLFLSVGAQAANAYDLNKMTDNQIILSALKVLEKNNQTDVLSRIDNNKTKVIFYDLTLISLSYAKHYAVASTDEYGDNYILINSTLKNSPKEALACLIAHESVHQLANATYEEEVQATRTEAKTWKLLKDDVSEKYSNDILVKRLNTLLLMEEAGQNNIGKAIAQNSFYKEQLSF